MKRTPSQYAQALFEALKECGAKSRKEVISGFIKLLEKNHAGSMMRRILVQYEKVYLSKNNYRKVEIESARKLPESVWKEMENIFSGRALIQEKHNPELIAGLTILLDDSIYIDASARTKINTLFA